MHNIFISYRREDSSWPARTLKAMLGHEFGEPRIFMDLDSITAGQDWPSRIDEALGACNVILILIGSNWLAVRDPEGQRRLDNPGDWVRLEIEAALGRADAAVVPVLLDGARMPGEDELPAPLRPLARRNAIALSTDRWASDFGELVRAIRGDVLGRVASEMPPPKLVALGEGKKHFEITSEQVIGRDEHADISLYDDELSRRHAKVWPTAEGLQIEDLQSTNGTWVNAEPVEGAQALRDGDIVRLGQLSFRVVIPALRAGRTRLAGSPAADSPPGD